MAFSCTGVMVLKPISSRAFIVFSESPSSEKGLRSGAPSGAAWGTGAGTLTESMVLKTCPQIPAWCRRKRQAREGGDRETGRRREEGKILKRRTKSRGHRCGLARLFPSGTP